jgi:hypothetical protein
MSYLYRFFLTIFLLILSIGLYSQQATVSSGGKVSVTSGSISYSIGQVVYNIAQGVNGSITEGLQQPYEISEITGIENKHITLSIFVYPNPTSDYLVLRLTEENKDYKYALFDIKGQLIKKEQELSIENRIEMSQYKSGTYLLKVTKSEKELKIFSIIKN